MANKLISDLDAATTPVDADVLEIDTGTESQKLTLLLLLGYMVAHEDFETAVQDLIDATPKEVCLSIACSDESTALTTGTGKVTFHMPYPMTLTEVIGELSTPQTSGSIFTADLNEAGTSVLSTKITIDNTEETSLTATPPVISDSALAKGAKMTVDFDQVGDGTAKGFKIHLIGTTP